MGIQTIYIYMCVCNYLTTERTPAFLLNQVLSLFLKCWLDAQLKNNYIHHHCLFRWKRSLVQSFPPIFPVQSIKGQCPFGQYMNTYTVYVYARRFETYCKSCCDLTSKLHVGEMIKHDCACCVSLLQHRLFKGTPHTYGATLHETQTNGHREAFRKSNKLMQSDSNHKEQTWWWNVAMLHTPSTPKFAELAGLKSKDRTTPQV